MAIIARGRLAVLDSLDDLLQTYRTPGYAAPIYHSAPAYGTPTYHSSPTFSPSLVTG